MQTFEETKATLAHAATLEFKNHEKPLILSSDASDTHVGAILEQEGKEGVMIPLEFFSKRLPHLKLMRSTFYKELRALFLSVKISTKGY